MKIKRFVREYANYQIDFIKKNVVGARQQAEDIERVESIVRNCERGLITIDEAMKMLSRV